MRLRLGILAALVGAMPLGAQSVGVDSAALALLERAATAYGSGRTLRATFRQTLTNPRTKTVYTSRGEFLQRGADRFSFCFTEPAGDRIVSDGTVLWLYLPSTAKGQVLKVPKAAGGGLDLASTVLRDPARRYTVVAGADTVLYGRGLRPVQLTPKTPDSPFTRATLWIDPVNALVRRAEFIEASGLIRLLEFTEVRTGQRLAADAFTFVPPPGVRVIDQAALLGGSVPTP